MPLPWVFSRGKQTKLVFVCLPHEVGGNLLVMQEIFVMGQNLFAGGVNSRYRLGKKLHRLFEVATPLGIMEAQLRPSLKHLNAILCSDV